MYHKVTGAGIGLGGVLPTTGVSWLYALLTMFVLISVGVAMIRLVPRWTVAHAASGFPLRVTRRNRS